MSEHSPEPWAPLGEAEVCDHDRDLIAQFFGETIAQIKANRALFLAAPEMKRRLQCVMEHLEPLRVGIDHWPGIRVLLATTEPAEPQPPTLLEACKAIVAGAVHVYDVRDKLLNAIAAEEAHRNADAETA